MKPIFSTIKPLWHNLFTVGILLTYLCFTAPRQALAQTDDAVRETMKRATKFMMDSVSYEGGFVWNYLPDFSRQWGELEAKRTMVWMQDPGTPAVGHLMLDAYHATGDDYYYEQAERIARLLIRGQHPSGGWNYMFDLAGEASIREWYATIGRQAWRLEEFQHYYGNATFDDSSTSVAAEFMLRMYLERHDPAIEASLNKVIAFVVNSQYPAGGWPQRFPLMYDHPFQGKADYSSFLTFNDNVITDNIAFLTHCYQLLGRKDLKDNIYRAMYSIISLQQDKPYAGWADQYTVNDMRPAHARSYEPRSVNTGTTVTNFHHSIEYYRMTGDTAFLSRLPDAIRFLESQRLPDEEVRRYGRRSRQQTEFLVPRFVDPDTGKPLYVHREGGNVVNGRYYTDQDIALTIAHYSSGRWVDTTPMWRHLDSIKAVPQEVATRNSPFLHDLPAKAEPYYHKPRANSDVRRIVDSLTERGCWLTPLSQTSNPYKPVPANMERSTSREYASTMVGDEYDTSPYTPKERIMCISTSAYIRNMTSLMGYLIYK